VPLIDAEGVTHLASGKVREIYAVEQDLLLVATDRMSAYDVVLPTPIPDKGAVLTGLTLWWLEQLAGVVPHHLLTARVEDMPAALHPFAAELRGRSMLCRRLEMAPVECVARGYLTGSGLLDYRATGAVSGHTLPVGLVDGSRLPEPLITPSTKAPIGEHDETITPEQAAALVGPELALELERITLEVYDTARALAEPRGVIVADTKLELGYDAAGVLRLGDEVLTPDSSRFWPAAEWKPGHAQASYDKQYVRDWLTATGARGEAVALPDEVVVQTHARYVEAYQRLTGSSFEDYLRSA